MKGELQTALDEMLKDLPRQFLKTKIEYKLKEANIEPKPARVDRVADAIMAGEEHFTLDDEVPDLDVTIAFSDEDIAELTESIEDFCSNQLPEVVTNAASETAHEIFKTLKKNWPAQKTWQDGERAPFEINLEFRWGQAFDYYRMLLTAAREKGEEYHRKFQKSRAKRNRHKRAALSRLHARACRVAEEILVLLKAGFADGAMARWRTLYEITTVATLISEYDDELAERYLLHEVVEAKRALDAYEKNYADLGYRPPSKREAANTRRAFDAVKERFGKPFCEPYGWAAHHLKINGKWFSDLEKAAQRSHMRSHYKFASQNVHAGTKGIMDQLGLIDSRDMVLAGPSNAGLEEPGQNAAISLVQITVLLFGPNWKFDDIIMIKVFLKLQEKAVESFIKISRQLKRDENALIRGSSEGSKDA
ncbi:DUF5677 domain-containing protein [Nitratireductor sp. OM-1]|uniref:DUF5677 domain-containing protein n=1 Tax=Nitratireductor sp. OM-1 TaxID=1756988 RepID=UPI000DDCE2A9|nr:DUF5677 domain-containing protein [Nitratireductor sp. OM-1]